MSRTSLVQGGKIVAGKSGKTSYGSGTFIPYDKAKKDYDTTKSVALGTKGVKDTAKGLVNSYQSLHPKKTEPTVLSTGTARSNFDTKIQPIIDRANTGLTEADMRKQQQKVEQQNALANGEVTPPEIQAELDAAKTPEQKANDDIMASFTKQSDAVTKAYKEMATAASRTSRAQIAVLENQLNDRKRMVEESNKSNLGTWRQQFIRTGQTEYSPGMTQDFISAKEREGMARLKDLDAEYAVKIDEVNSALESKKFSIAADKALALQKIEDKVQAQITENLKITREENKRLFEQSEKLKRDATIVDLYQSGVTDPLDLYSQLALEGNLGDFTLGDILNMVGKIESTNDKQSTKQVAEQPNVPTGGYDIGRGFDYGKSKMADVKGEVRKMFPADFGTKLITELTDEQLREFMMDYVDDSNTNQQNIDPEQFLIEWAGGIGLDEDTGGSSDEMSNPF